MLFLGILNHSITLVTLLPEEELRGQDEPGA